MFYVNVVLLNYSTLVEFLHDDKYQTIHDRIAKKLMINKKYFSIKFEDMMLNDYNLHMLYSNCTLNVVLNEKGECFKKLCLKGYNNINLNILKSNDLNIIDLVYKLEYFDWREFERYFLKRYIREECNNLLDVDLINHRYKPYLL